MRFLGGVNPLVLLDHLVRVAAAAAAEREANPPPKPAWRKPHYIVETLTRQQRRHRLRKGTL